MGDGVKRIEDNERDAAIVQRRCLRAASDLPAGHVLRAKDLQALRPRPNGSLEPWQQQDVLGKPLPRAFARGEALMRDDFS